MITFNPLANRIHFLMPTILLVTALVVPLVGLGIIIYSLAA